MIQIRQPRLNNPSDQQPLRYDRSYKECAGYKQVSYQVIFKPMNNQGDSNICVVIRKRPINKKEINNNQEDIVAVQNRETVIVSEYKQKVDLTKYIEESAFNFDYAFGQGSNNEEIYLTAVRPLIESAFLGARVTCFAYGQTGSGKTYTMNGDAKQGLAGLYVLGAQDIFSYRNSKEYANLKISMSFFEIYCGKLFDLLKGRAELKIREDDKSNVHIIGLNQEAVSTPEDFMKILEFGSNQRRTAQNSTNADSSRSHAILQITLKEGKKIKGKISFIDLAGCERGADHMDQNKQTKIDGAEINKSLLALKQCIRALDQGKGHTPFRGSKLTMVLKDSLTGFCRTVMICNISPNSSSCENTLNTLRYADRVKQLKKGGNESLTRQEIAAKQLMLPRNGKNAVKIMIDKGDDMEDIMNKKLEARQMMGIKEELPKMMVEEAVNRPKNNTFVDKVSIKKIESQDPKNLSKGYQNNSRNEPGLFDNCKTLEMRPKQNTLSSPGNKEISHPYPQKNIPKNNDQRNPGQNQYSYDEGQRQSSFSQSNGYNNPNYHNHNQNPNNNPYQNQNMNSNQPLFGNYQQQYNPSHQQSMNPMSNQSWAQPSNQYPQHQNQQQYNPQSYQNNSQQQSQYYNNPQFGGRQQSQYNQRPFNQQPEPEQFPPYRRQQSLNVQTTTNHFNRNPQNNYQDNPRYSVEPEPNHFQSSNHLSNNYQSSQQQHPRSSSIRSNGVFQENDQSSNQHQSVQWENAVQKFKEWNYLTNNQDEVRSFRHLHSMLVDKLVEEEDNLASEHSQTINGEIETIKGEMKFIQEIQKNKVNHQSIEYAEFIQDMIDRKFAVLMKLKHRVKIFKEHLIEHQECEQKMFMAQEQMTQNEEMLLMDDLEEDN